jgi:uracil-DNA glycosylase
MTTSNEILHYQQQCWKTYKEKLGISPNYRYLYGNPVKVHVPVDTACGGLMIIGAYPTARFNAIGSERDVPMEDHLYPFSNEMYFDGSRMREVDSGRELEELFLKPLGISRDKIWITDLVKIFLFKVGHISKYKRLIETENLVDCTADLVKREDFMTFAKLDKNMQFIKQEIELCKPSVILGLGAEVNAVMFNLSVSSVTKAIEACQAFEYKLNGNTYSYFACPHPGILMREDENGKWKGCLRKIIEEVKTLV